MEYGVSGHSTSVLEQQTRNRQQSLLPTSIVQDSARRQGDPNSPFSSEEDKTFVLDKFLLKICRWPSWCCIEPLKLTNYFGTAYTLFIIFAIAFADIYWACPGVFDRESCVPLIRASYIVIGEIFVNLVLFHYYARYNQFKFLVPGKLKKDAPRTKWCFTCKYTVPERAHHCPICNFCVYQKDHHCFLVGGCVGFGNQRFFITFLFWAIVGTGYGGYFLFAYLNRFMTPFFTAFGWIDYLGPVSALRWLLFGHLSGQHALLFCLSMGSMLGAIGFFMFQMYLVGNGVTMMESLKTGVSKAEQEEYAERLSTRHLTVLQRYRCIMGPYWPIQFLLPLPFLRNRIDQETLSYLYAAQSKDL